MMWILLSLIFFHLSLASGVNEVFLKQNSITGLGECNAWYNSSILLIENDVPAQSVCIQMCLANSGCLSASFTASERRCALHAECPINMPLLFCPNKMELFERKNVCSAMRGTNSVYVQFCTSYVDSPGQKWVIPPSLPSSVTYSDCSDALNNGNTKSGIYNISLEGQTLQVWCDLDPDFSQAWTVIQRREDGRTEFYRCWNDYRTGFGHMDGEFWIGLETLHQLTAASVQLMVTLESWDGEVGRALYTSFSVAEETDGYRLSVAGFLPVGEVDIGDGLAFQNGATFSTSDNGVYDICAVKSRGAWWYAGCHTSNLNGLYFQERPVPYYISHGSGAVWYPWKGYHDSLKYVEMKIKV